MNKYRIQRFQQNITVPINEDTELSAALSEQINGLLRGIVINAPVISGSSYTFSLLGPRGEVLFSKATLSANGLTPILVDANNHPLRIPLSILAGVQIMKIKTAGTTDATGQLTLASDASQIADGDTVTINGPTDSRTYRFKNTTAAINDIKIIPHVAATAVLTSDENNDLNAAQVVVGAKTYTFKTALTETKASGVITSTANGNPSEDETITIGAVTYRFRNTLAQVNDVLIGASGEATLNNLRAAINLTGTEGVEYFAGQVIHPTVTAPSVAVLNVADYDLTVQAKTIGTGGNSIVLTELATNITVSGAGTLAGGLAAVANEVLVGSDADDSLLNLKKAVNGEAGEGTKYSTGTVASTEVTCGAVTAHAVTFTAIATGPGGNSLAKSEDSAHLDYDGAGATFTGGQDNGFETLENLKLAIGAAGSGDGSDYHAGTTAHGDVTAARTDGVLTVTAKEPVESGADVATTESSGVLSWGAATLSSGGEAAARTFNIDLYIDRG